MSFEGSGGGGGGGVELDLVSREASSCRDAAVEKDREGKCCWFRGFLRHRAAGRIM